MLLVQARRASCDVALVGGPVSRNAAAQCGEAQRPTS